MSIDDDRLPWDKQPGETNRQYMGFLTYRNLGMRRSIRRLREEFYSRSHSSHSTLAEWSATHRWQERCAAWDRHEADRVADETRQAIVDMNKRHAAIANAALNKAVENLTALDASTLTPRDLVAMIDLAVKVERLARGEASTSIAVSGELPAQWRPQPTVEVLADVVAALFEAGAIGTAPTPG
jgi:hypothetical protein